VKIDRALVANVARLAALEPSEAELDELAGQLTRIVEHFEALREIPEAVLSENPDSPPAPLRADEARDGSPEALVALNAPDFAHGHFVVPRVVSRN
jgi:aspartyl-tRNA(Asn)/glutamyl-tRNA(Gln) amidotransferase subunit C